jgi:hypothetical protein
MILFNRNIFNNIYNLSKLLAYRAKIAITRSVLSVLAFKYSQLASLQFIMD